MKTTLKTLSFVNYRLSLICFELPQFQKAFYRQSFAHIYMQFSY